jgi:hypothetical protein
MKRIRFNNDSTYSVTSFLNNVIIYNYISAYVVKSLHPHVNVNGISLGEVGVWCGGGYLVYCEG